MTSESIKLYKLIILYFLNKAKQDISNAILSDFILEYGYTDYFSIQETLTTLTEDNMICARQTHTTSYYSITEKGLETLDFFCSQLPKDTIQQIENYLSEHKIQIMDNTSVRTDFTQIAPHEYLAKGMVTERGSTIFEAALTVPSEEEALRVCERFKKKSAEIYSSLFKALSTD
jgi:DNA-binding PadR family transcriptional regulator